MKLSTAIGSTVAMSICAVGLYGCTGVNWKVSVDCDTTNPHPVCTVHGEVSGPIGGGGGMMQAAAAAVGLTSTGPDAGSFSLDVSNSSTPYPSSGQVTVTLYSSGSVVAASQFPWGKSGNTISLTNPSAVNAWAANYPSADKANYAIVPFQPSETYGTYTIAATSVYQGTHTASAMSSYTYCSPPGVHSPFPCAGGN